MKKIRLKTIKCKLKNILRKDINYHNLFDAINRMNEVTTLCYMFIRSYLIYLYENKKTFPIINKKFICLVYKTLSISKLGRPPTDTTELNKLNEYYLIFSKKLNITTKFNSHNLSYLYGAEAEIIYTSIINNIKYHFPKYINKFIKVFFADIYKKKLKTLKGNDLKEFKKLLNSNNAYIINDILNNTKNAPSELYNKLGNHINKIVPKLPKNIKVIDDIFINPLNYLHNMIYINLYLEKKEIKNFQFFPLKTNINNYYKINSSALIDIFENNGKLKLLTSVSKVKEQIWKKYFNLSKMKIKNYTFNYEISTDGYAVSINYIFNGDIKSKIISNLKKIEARNKTYKLKKSLDELQIKKLNKEREDAKKQKKMELYEKKKKFKLKQKEAYNKLSQIEKDKLKLELRLKKEYPYIDHLVKDKIMRKYLEEKVENKLLAVNDPGKGEILYIAKPTKKKMDNTMSIKQIEVEKKDIKTENNKFANSSTIDNITFFRYTNKRRVKELKRLKYGRLIENKKKKIKIGNKTIKEIESSLSSYNCKSCNYKTFMEYLKEKLKVNSLLKNAYGNKYFRKLKWFAYINKQRHEDKLLNEIEDKLGSREELVIISGDWSGNGISKYMSTPNKNIIKKLSERFKIMMIDEFKTSQLHYKHNTKCDNLSVPITKASEFKILKYKNKNGEKIKKKVKRKKKKKDQSYLLNKQQNVQNIIKRTSKNIHSVLTSKSEVMECINRNKNAVLNMLRIVYYEIKTGKRPNIFSRNKKTSGPIKNRGNQKMPKGAYRKIEHQLKQQNQLSTQLTKRKNILSNKTQPSTQLINQPIKNKKKSKNKKNIESKIKKEKVRQPLN